MEVFISCESPGGGFFFLKAHGPVGCGSGGGGSLEEASCTGIERWETWHPRNRGRLKKGMEGGREEDLEASSHPHPVPLWVFFPVFAGHSRGKVAPA